MGRKKEEKIADISIVKRSPLKKKDGSASLYKVRGPSLFKKSLVEGENPQ